jgi:hypothetical protein
MIRKIGAKAISTPGAQFLIDSAAREQRLGGTPYYVYVFARGDD